VDSTGFELLAGLDNLRLGHLSKSAAAYESSEGAARRCNFRSAN
jgi:hypothetical protein